MRVVVVNRLAAAVAETVDLALAMPDEGPFAAPFVPVRFDASLGWGAALKRVDDDLRFASETGPMTFDLPARIADLGVRMAPLAAMALVRAKTQTSTTMMSLANPENPWAGVRTPVPTSTAMLASGRSTSPISAWRRSPPGKLLSLSCPPQR